MSKFLENNKQFIHIASEVVVLCALVLYNNQKHKKVMKHIEDLVQKVEDQEDMIQKHEEIIKKLVAYINNQQPAIVPKNQKIKPSFAQPSTSAPKPAKPKRSGTPHREPPLTPPPNIPKPQEQRVNFQEAENENDSDLDAEMSEELAELRTTDEKEVNLVDMVN
jgi:hypothetical protein